jgi:hypothetical protein
MGKRLLVAAIVCGVFAALPGCSSSKPDATSATVAAGGSDGQVGSEDLAPITEPFADASSGDSSDETFFDDSSAVGSSVTEAQTVEAKLTADFADASIANVSAAVACVKRVAPNATYTAFNDKPTRIAVKAIRECVGDELATNMAKSSLLEGITVEQAKCVVLAQLDTAASLPSEENVEAVFSADAIADFPDDARASMLKFAKPCNVTAEQLDTILST